MGEHGTRALLPALGPIDMALVGEPTRMRRPSANADW